jgi:predicted DNA binding CopG/RHH family protein
MNKKMFDYLDKEEQELIGSLDQPGWQPAGQDKVELFTKAAKVTALKDKRVNIRMTTNDYENIKYRAADEGLPYQSLISSVVHRYLTGQLVARA